MNVLEHPPTISHEFIAEGFTVRCHMDICDSPKLSPILYLPGAFQGDKGLQPIREHLSSIASSIRIELPGTCNEDVLPFDYDFRWISDIVKRALDLIEQSRVNMLTASYSTPIGLCLSSKYPDTIDRWVMGGAISHFSDDITPDIERSIEFLELGKKKAFARIAIAQGLMNLDPQVSIHRREQVFRVMFRQLSRLDDLSIRRYIANTNRVLGAGYYVSKLNRPHIPVLGFTGEHDILTKASECRAFVSTFPSSLFATIRDTDHMFLLEDFKSTFRLIRDFFIDKLQFDGNRFVQFESFEA